MKVHESCLDNGLQIIAELNDERHSVAFGFFVRAGARDDEASYAGTAHMLEHMAFKGGGPFNGEAVRRRLDEVGARYNASTSRDLTQFYANVLPENLPTAFEIMANIMRPTIDNADLESEKQVVLEEIHRHADQATAVASNSAMTIHFAGHPLGNPILGTVDSVASLNVSKLRESHQRFYGAGNVVLAVTGRAAWSQVEELTRRHCGQWCGERWHRPAATAKGERGSVTIAHHSQLQHVVLVCGGPGVNHELRFAATLLAIILGDLNGSLLYREFIESGLACDAKIDHQQLDGCGVFKCLLVCQPGRTQNNLERLMELSNKLTREGVSRGQLERAKCKLCSRAALCAESPIGRLTPLGSNWVYRGRHRSLQQYLNDVRQVSESDIRNLLAEHPLDWTATAMTVPASKT